MNEFTELQYFYWVFVSFLLVVPQTIPRFTFTTIWKVYFFIISVQRTELQRKMP